MQRPVHPDVAKSRRQPNAGLTTNLSERTLISLRNLAPFNLIRRQHPMAGTQPEKAREVCAWARGAWIADGYKMPSIGLEPRMSIFSRRKLKKSSAPFRRRRFSSPDIR
jgi:hypothetical protein